MEAIEYGYVVEIARIKRALRPKWRVFPAGGFKTRWLAAIYWICSCLKRHLWEAAFGWLLYLFHLEGTSSRIRRYYGRWQRSRVAKRTLNEQKE